jgi:hypothetical protein
MGEQIIWHGCASGPEMGDGIGHIGRIPIDDRGDHEIEARRAKLLCLETSISDPALPERADYLGQNMALLASRA